MTEKMNSRMNERMNERINEKKIILTVLNRVSFYYTSILQIKKHQNYLK